MLIDGLRLNTGTSIENAKVSSGNIFPTVPYKGLMFFLDVDLPTYDKGLYVYDGATWISGDITAIAAGTGLVGGGTTGDVAMSIDTNVVASQIDLSTVAGNLQANINAETINRSTDDITLQTNIDSEASARLNADNLLQGTVDAEAATRLSSDNALQTNIDAEVTARTDADTAHAADLTLHLTAAQNTLIDGILPTVTSAEINHLDGAIDNIQGQLDAKATAAAMNTHVSSAAVHLTTAQNALLDGIAPTVSSTEINYLDGVTSGIQSQLDTLNTGSAAGVSAHATDLTLHLTAAQNTLLDGIAPTVSSTEINYLDGVTSGIQSQLDTLNTSDLSHIANTDLHLTVAQNTLIDGILPTVTSAEINHLDGVTSGIQSQIDAKLSNAGGTMTGLLVLSNDPTLAAHAATKSYVDNAALAGSNNSNSNTPTNTTPADIAIDISVTPTLIASAYSGTDTHEHSIFQVSTDNTFATVDYDSGILGNVTSHTVATDLTAELVYYWRVKYIGITSSSGWSTATSFTTAIAFSSLFATTLYTGTGASLGIVTGLDAVANPSLVWLKGRNIANQHYLLDTIRGVNKSLSSNASTQQVNQSAMLDSFNNNSITLGSNAETNNNSSTFVAWQWIARAGFMDIVSYVGDGVAGRTVAHNLGTTFGMALVKGIGINSSWLVQHKDTGGTKYITLDGTGGTSISITTWNDTGATANDLILGTDSWTNGSGTSYIAYLFAHNPANGIFCGSYTGTGTSSNKIVTGFPVGWLMVKRTDLAENWVIIDIKRTAFDTELYPNGSYSEGGASLVIGGFDGFTVNSLNTMYNATGGNYIFLALADPAQF